MIKLIVWLPESGVKISAKGKTLKEANEKIAKIFTKDLVIARYEIEEN